MLVVLYTTPQNLFTYNFSRFPTLQKSPHWSIRGFIPQKLCVNISPRAGIFKRYMGDTL
jgi:hypothetical protein